VNVSYVNPFISSTMNLFKTMMNTVVKASTPCLKKQPFPTYDISAIIGLSGDAQGSVAISFPKLVALKVVSEMVGTKIIVIGPELTDGIGELANIVAGNAKKDLAEYKLSISLPNVIIGKGHMLSAPSGAPSILIPFQSKFGDFALEISLKTK